MKTMGWMQALDTDELVGFLTKKLPKLAAKQYKVSRKALNDIELDVALRSMGLQRYSPSKNVAGSIGLFVLGCVAGGIAALALTPVKGQELRTQVKTRARTLLSKTEGPEIVTDETTARA